MIVKGALTASQMAAGRRNLNIFNLINGLSYICLGEMVIILFALRMDSPDFCIAMLGSFFFISYLFMPLGKFFTAWAGGAHAISLCWVLRNISALTVASAPLAAKYIGPAAGIAVIMIGAFGFYVFRAIGMVGIQPLIGECTTIENRGKFSAVNSRLFNISAMLMLGLIIFLMHQSKALWMYEAIILMGAAIGFISAYFMWKVDETETVRSSARKPIMDDVRNTLRNPSRMKLVAVCCTINASITLTAPISMLALKRSYDISDSNALFFALAMFAGGIGISYLAGLLAEETGPRPLTILFYCAQLALCLFWVIGPDTFKWYYSMWPFILSGVASSGTYITLSHYCLATIPNKERVGAFLTINGVAGVVAGIIGCVLGGGLLRWFNYMNIPALEMFKIYFLVIMMLLLIGLLLVLRLEKRTDWEVGDVLGLAFAPRDIMALFSLYGIKRLASPRQEQEDIARLLEIKSGLSEKALLSYLDSPQFSMRIRALSALNEIPFGSDAIKMILRELEEGEHTTAHMAAQIAGERGLKEAIPLLRKHLSSDDFYLLGKSMLALAQLDDKDSFHEIREIFRMSSNPRIVTYGASALAIIGDDASFKLLLEKTLVSGMPSKVLYEIIYSIAQIEGHGDGVYSFLKLYSKDAKAAAMHLSEVCAEPEKALHIAKGFSSGSISRPELCRTLVETIAQSGSKHAPLLAQFLRSPLVQEAAPAELLLSLLAFAKKSAKV